MELKNIILDLWKVYNIDLFTNHIGISSETYKQTYGMLTGKELL